MINNGSLCYLSMLTDATPLQPTYTSVFGAELREVFTQVPHAPLTCRLLSVRSGGTVLLPFIAFFLSYVCAKHELIIASLRFPVNTKNTIYSSGQGRWDTSSFLSRSINSFTA